MCSRMYSRGIPKALHDLRDLWKLFVTVSLILLVRTVRVRSTVNEWLILRTPCFFSTCNKHSRHAGIILTQKGLLRGLAQAPEVIGGMRRHDGYRLSEAERRAPTGNS